ncbi:MAG TPA: PLD nuclease N-terminal domain-containing protein [Jatrophihabitans sp.]|jgi:hypothetical protein
MLLFDGFGGLLVLGVWIFCFIDVLMTPETACRNLPKLAWVFLVLLLPVFGSIVWLVAGHPWNRVPGSGTPRSAGAARTTRMTQRSRTPARTPTNPDDDEEFLASLNLRAEEQRRRAREQQERETRDPRDSGDADAG